MAPFPKKDQGTIDEKKDNKTQEAGENKEQTRDT